MKRIVNLMLISALTFASITSCMDRKDKGGKEAVAMEVQKDEDFRPNFHFTPEKNWMNDPNGMFFYNGYFHLFFQHYPDDNVWGPMHWGHAISTDMITWKEQPIALEPDEKGYIFSGSAVVDNENTSGFGKDGKVPIVAMFTYHDPKGAEAGEIDHQSQAIAYSLDEGKTWTKYEGNPVIENPGIKDFRDPKVIWDGIHQQWVMVLAADDKSMFYISKNLKDWELASEFGKGLGAHGGVWECPDFFPMYVEDSDEVKWVLIQSLNPGGYNGGSGTQYFIGDFDGKEFTPVDEMQDLGEDHNYWIDFGKDNYAGVTWANIPEENGRKLFIGWMSNWQYAQEVPTETWRSAMTVARELKLEKNDGSYMITSVPARELKNYRSINYKEENVKINGTTKLIDSAKIDLSSAEIRFKISDLKQTDYKFSLSNSQGDELVFGYDHAEKEFYLDRSKAGQTGFSEDFANKISTAPRISDAGDLTGIIILDKTSVELFFDDGKTVMTEIFFPNYPWEQLSVSAENGEFTLDQIDAYQLKFK
ncbi:glycoside hydrolase family 32 protein [Gramella jeungdoensis]|uniref:Glycoside hydrolase family 32 protein n=1 Tax=Gramella jeungdoensis TaxID=708091 RepID=A0ABT0YZP5_9FLAO|nr:glycoside hydrolase family 32 protein [Gramella jeungdoensis]MCM8568618.1 glycoside hydrolase family 32 protein [Gramella jeungdoensis]